ncbi:MAG TPA: hypothetical protein VFK86_02630 [Bauldia sp.]|nr:hypothetical protein [Bauldia sp.]
MSAILRLLIVVPIGFVLAVIAAGLTVAVGLVGPSANEDAIGWLIMLAAWAAAYAGAIALIPWLIAVVFAEGFGFRSVFYWFAVGGVIGAAAYALSDFVGDTAEGGFGIAVHLAAGFVGGFAYWLIAGRTSGEGFVRPDGRSAP